MDPLNEFKSKPVVTPDATVFIGEYGCAVNVKIADETDDHYLFVFHNHYTGEEAYQGWYSKDEVKLIPRRMQ